MIDLKFSGRNLTAPPEGYTRRSEANVKRWIAALPAPSNAAPEDAATIVVRNIICVEWTPARLVGMGHV